MTIRPLTDLDAAGLPEGARLKICIVSLLGAAHNGGIGTATNAMARHIALDGHDVTLLYSLVEYGVPVNVSRTGEQAGGLRPWNEWVDDLAGDGVRLEMLDHQGSHDDWLEKSWQIKEFVGSHQFDVVYFDEWQGGGYYSLLAKRAGLAPFVDQVHVVFTHASKRWVCATNDEYLRKVSDVTVLGMEQRCVEMADVVISPSRYLLAEYQSYGWNLPDNSFFHPLPLLKEPVTAETRYVHIEEIVFFGRLEVRKGLWLFCDALDRLNDRLAGKIVTFMGPLTSSFGTSSAVKLLQRSANWRFRVQLVTDHDSSQAQRYMASGGRLALMPSLDDNSPCVVYECMQAGIPFLTTSAGGARELIEQGCWGDAVVEPTVDALADRLALVLRKGARRSVPSFSPVDSLSNWTGWLRLVAQDPAAFRTVRDPQPPPCPGAAPLLVVIDGGGCPVSTLVRNLSSLVQRFQTTARIVMLSNRRGHAWEAVQDLLSTIQGAEIGCFGPTSHVEARQIIAEAETAFFMDADTELLTPFFVLALGVLARPDPVMVSCLGAKRTQDPQAAPRIDLFPTGDIPGLAALGHVVTGPVWAVSPKKMPQAFDRLSFHDDRHDELTGAWTLGETMVRGRGAADLVLLPIVGAITPASDPSSPLRTAEQLRTGARQLGVGTSLHSGGAPWFAIATFGTRADMPGGALTLPSYRSPPPVPQGQTQALAEAEAEGDLARLAAIYGRPELALQIESGRQTSAARVQHLIDLAVDAARLRPRIDLLTWLPGSFPEGATGIGNEQNALPVSVFFDPRLVIAEGRLRSTGSTRSGGPAKFRFLDVPIAGQTALELRFRSLAPQPLLLRIKAIDQDSGDMIAEAALRVAPRDPGETRLALPGIHGRMMVVIELSGAERIDLATDLLAIR